MAGGQFYLDNDDQGYVLYGGYLLDVTPAYILPTGMP